MSTSSAAPCASASIEADEKFHTRSLPQEEETPPPVRHRWETRWS